MQFSYHLLLNPIDGNFHKNNLRQSKNGHLHESCKFTYTIEIANCFIHRTVESYSKHNNNENKNLQKRIEEY